MPFSEERVASFDGLLLPVHKLIYVQERIDVVDVTLHDLATALEQAGEEDAAIYFSAIDEYEGASRSRGGVATIGFVAEHGLLLDEPEF